MVLQLIPRLHDRGMHLLHRISELHTETTEDIPLPCIIFSVDSGLDLLVIHDTDTKTQLRF
jgi:hypothetical protein